ncbi:MAG: L,D-transpeptidase [Chitinophagaceae bacterium]
MDKLMLKNSISIATFLLSLMLLSHSCKPVDKRKVPDKFKYEAFKDSIRKQNNDVAPQANNIFDANLFIPGRDSLNPLLKKIDALWQQDLQKMILSDSSNKNVKKTADSTNIEKTIARYNLKMLDSFLNTRDTLSQSSCSGTDCFIYVDVIKSIQILYLYIEGELKDSFIVSTGKKNFETPSLSTKPSGPLFTKYTSRKFPGGNYKGLGNMPYVVFVKGGYAIHGTTPGNFKKLGTRASHGCIRLHPDNARLFYELVKLIGIENTWVVVRDTL